MKLNNKTESMEAEATALITGMVIVFIVAVTAF